MSTRIRSLIKKGNEWFAQASMPKRMTAALLGFLLMSILMDGAVRLVFGTPITAESLSEALEATEAEQAGASDSTSTTISPEGIEITFSDSRLEPYRDALAEHIDTLGLSSESVTVTVTESDDDSMTLLVAGDAGETAKLNISGI